MSYEFENEDDTVNKSDYEKLEKKFYKKCDQLFLARKLIGENLIERILEIYRDGHDAFRQPDVLLTLKFLM